MFGLGMGELIIILVLVLLLFGSKKLPMLGSSIAKGIKNFKQGMNEDDDEKNHTTKKIDE